MIRNRKVKDPIVAITKGMSEGRSLEKALDLLPMDKIIQKGDKVIITPNWVKDKSPKDGVVVGPKTLKKLIQYIKTKEPDLKEKCINYYGIDLLFILGAGLGALFTNAFKEKAVLFCCVTLFIGFIVMFIKEDILIFKSKETEK